MSATPRPRRDPEAAARLAKERVAALRPLCRPASTENAYLTSHCVSPTSTLFEVDREVACKHLRSHLPSREGNLTGDVLLVAFISHLDEIASAQLIDASGRKHFVANAPTAGAYWCTEDLAGREWDAVLVLILVEGVAKAIAAAAAMPSAVGIAAMSVGNLKATAEDLRARFPDARIIVMGDLGNGEKQAREAALAVAADFALPDLDGSPSAKDANDQIRLKGIESLGATLAAATKPEAEPARDPITVDLTTTQEEAITWLWLYFLAIGEITLLTGAPGMGKTLLEIELAAAVSTGRQLPGNSFTRKPAHVVLVDYEDDIARVLLPRLRVAGSDLSHVHPVDFSKADIVLPDHWDAIEAEIARWKAELVIIDPFPAFFSRDLSTNNDADVRKAARPGVAIARKHGCAMLLTRHTNKLQTGGAIAKGGGSIGFTGIARAEFLLGASDEIEQENARILACVKTNLARKPPSRAFLIEETDGIPRIRWSGEVDMTADRLAEAKGNAGRAAEKRDNATQIIEAALADGQWHRQREVVAEMENAGIAERTWKAAKAKLGKATIQSRKGTKLEGGDWWWRLAKVHPLHALPPCTVAPLVPGSDCTLAPNNINKIGDEECNRATVQDRGQGCTVDQDDTDPDAFQGTTPAQTTLPLADDDEVVT